MVDKEHKLCLYYSKWLDKISPAIPSMIYFINIYIVQINIRQPIIFNIYIVQINIQEDMIKCGSIPLFILG